MKLICGKVLSVSLALFLAGMAHALLGGFGVAVTLPPADAKDGVLVIEPIGCHGPGAAVTAHAEGIVNGARKTIPLSLSPMEGDKYLLKRQWPADGKWVLVFSAQRDGLYAHTLVRTENGKVPMKDSPWGQGQKAYTCTDGKTKLQPWTFVGDKKVVATYVVHGNLKSAVSYALTSAQLN
jgi:hypothetical protein